MDAGNIFEHIWIISLAKGYGEEIWAKPDRPVMGSLDQLWVETFPELWETTRSGDAASASGYDKGLNPILEGLFHPFFSALREEMERLAGLWLVSPMLHHFQGKLASLME